MDGLLFPTARAPSLARTTPSPVIPAQAGIHYHYARSRDAASMDPDLRQDDDDHGQFLFSKAAA